ncbi:hypothetical protein U9M48_018937 [Paspalum notatum var. saurae]|uniref:Reverse transcriptase domain-containing protein n=1 Tax=Paspalum notatum var. saurae TaxID=547442 RepID=A0AAQ3TBN3_PASNO
MAIGRKKHTFIPILIIDDHNAASQEELEQVIFDHFPQLFGVAPSRQFSLSFDTLGYEPVDHLQGLIGLVEPSTRAPGPSLSWLPLVFYLMNDGSFSCLNSGLVVLFPKRQGASASAFIRGRSILDSFKFVQCAAVLFRKRKIPKMLFKLEISKAFDSLSWAFLLEVLAALGFSTRWRDWISILLSLASSQVLVNGSPIPKITHRRGVCQGDFLSPLLFVLAVDCLNRLYHCSLYADDVILFASPKMLEALALWSLLHSFGVASGLSANLNKCSITPISISSDKLVPIASALGCAVADFPIAYLGFPLSSKH